MFVCFLLSEILKHEELEGKIKTACLGSLLLPEDLNRLEDQYLTHKEVKLVSVGLNWGQPVTVRRVCLCCCVYTVSEKDLDLVPRESIWRTVNLMVWLFTI